LVTAFLRSALTSQAACRSPAEKGPQEWIGAEVWGTGGDVGFTRDGTHAELIAVPVASLRRKPETLNFADAASVGVNFMAAWCGTVEAAASAGLKALQHDARLRLIRPAPPLLAAGV